MSADVATLPARSANPFETARLALVKQLLELKAPQAMPAFPSPGHHLSVRDHLKQAAFIFDQWLAAVGHEVRDNASIAIDADVFTGAFTGALEDNALYVCEKAAEDLIDARRNMRRA